MHTPTRVIRIPSRQYQHKQMMNLFKKFTPLNIYRWKGSKIPATESVCKGALMDCIFPKTFFYPNAHQATGIPHLPQLCEFVFWSEESTVQYHLSEDLSQDIILSIANNVERDKCYVLLHLILSRDFRASNSKNPLFGSSLLCALFLPHLTCTYLLRACALDAHPTNSNTPACCGSVTLRHNGRMNSKGPKILQLEVVTSCL